MQVTLLLVIDKGDNGGNPLSSFFMNQALFCNWGLTAEVCANNTFGEFFLQYFSTAIEFLQDCDAVITVDCDAVITVDCDAVITVDCDAVITVDCDAVITVDCDAVIAVDCDAVIML